MTHARLTPLSYALLGLLRDQPRSGYGLRKVFETTPLGGYSSSPGSIYPALKSLERAGLVEVEGTGSARSRGLNRLTLRGADTLSTWLRGPVGDLHEAMLRFAFLPEEDRGGILTFLYAFEVAARSQVAGLNAFLASDVAQTMTRKSRMAVEHGRRELNASARWAVWARRQVTD